MKKKKYAAHHLSFLHLHRPAIWGFFYTNFLMQAALEGMHDEEKKNERELCEVSFVRQKAFFKRQKKKIGDGL